MKKIKIYKSVYTLVLLLIILKAPISFSSDESATKNGCEASVADDSVFTDAEHELHSDIYADSNIKFTIGDKGSIGIALRVTPPTVTTYTPTPEYFSLSVILSNPSLQSILEKQSSEQITNVHHIAGNNTIISQQTSRPLENISLKQLEANIYREDISYIYNLAFSGNILNIKSGGTDNLPNSFSNLDTQVQELYLTEAGLWFLFLNLANNFIIELNNTNQLDLNELANLEASYINFRKVILKNINSYYNQNTEELSDFILLLALNSQSSLKKDFNIYPQLLNLNLELSAYSSSDLSLNLKPNLSLNSRSSSSSSSSSRSSSDSISNQKYIINYIDLLTLNFNSQSNGIISPNQIWSIIMDDLTIYPISSSESAEQQYHTYKTGYLRLSEYKTFQKRSFDINLQLLKLFYPELQNVNNNNDILKYNLLRNKILSQATPNAPLNIANMYLKMKYAEILMIINLSKEFVQSDEFINYDQENNMITNFLNIITDKIKTYRSNQSIQDFAYIDMSKHDWDKNFNTDILENLAKELNSYLILNENQISVIDEPILKLVKEVLLAGRTSNKNKFLRIQTSMLAPSEFSESKEILINKQMSFRNLFHLKDFFNYINVISSEYFKN